MGEGNRDGIIRIGKKGLRKFAIGDEGAPGSEPFVVDVVQAFQQWIVIDDSFRPTEEDVEGRHLIAPGDMVAYNRAAVEFVNDLANSGDTPKPATRATTAEALDFLARLRECYDELADFFRPRSRDERASPDTSAEHSPTLVFSEEPSEERGTGNQGLRAPADAV
jgi:hypothetical protein